MNGLLPRSPFAFPGHVSPRLGANARGAQAHGFDMAKSKDEQRLEALEDAYFSGVLTVTYGDKSTTYRSSNDMLKAINALRARLGLDGGGRRRRIACFTKDL